MNGVELAVTIMGVLILVCFSSVLVVAETALTRVSRIHVRYLAERKVRGAGRLERILEDSRRFLVPLMILKVSAQIASASLATWPAIELTGNAAAGVLVATALAVLLICVLGELVPRAVASLNIERLALASAGPAIVVGQVMRPLTSLFELIARAILFLTGKKGSALEGITLGEDERRALVNAAGEHDEIEEEEKEMIHSVFEFSDTVVREVMVPRPDMITISADATVMEAVALIIECGYSRIPVYEDELDKIAGILYAKDLMGHLSDGDINREVGSLLREAFIIPETKVLSQLLKELQQRKVHIAIVVDEYGTVAGLATIEDLIEEIVGEILDEFDREEDLVEKIGERRFRVDARINLEELNERLDIDLPDEGGVDSVGGLVLKVLGHVPAPGEAFTYNRIVITVEKLRNNRISEVMVEVLPQGEPGHGS